MWTNEPSKNIHMGAERSSNHPSNSSHHIVCVHHLVVVVSNIHTYVIVLLLPGHTSVCACSSFFSRHVTETKHVSVTVVAVTVHGLANLHTIQTCVLTAVTKWWLSVGIRAFFYLQIVKFNLFCSSEGK